MPSNYLSQPYWPKVWSLEFDTLVRHVKEGLDVDLRPGNPVKHVSDRFSTNASSEAASILYSTLHVTLHLHELAKVHASFAILFHQHESDE